MGIFTFQWLMFFRPNTLFLLFLRDLKLGVSHSSLYILTDSERKCNICISKSKFGCRQTEPNQVLKIEALAIVFMTY